MLFESSDLPFYKFGAVHYLKKIKLEEWVPFIAAKFKKSGKSISGKDVETVCLEMDCHSYYTQYAFQIVWCISDSKVSWKQIQLALLK
jgi:hypothetical protein